MKRYFIQIELEAICETDGQAVREAIIASTREQASIIKVERVNQWGIAEHTIIDQATPENGLDCETCEGDGTDENDRDCEACGGTGLRIELEDGSEVPSE